MLSTPLIPRLKLIVQDLGANNPLAHVTTVDTKPETAFHAACKAATKAGTFIKSAVRAVKLIPIAIIYITVELMVITSFNGLSVC